MGRLLRGTVRTSAIVRGQPDDVVARIRAGFDRRMQAYRAGRTYDIEVTQVDDQGTIRYRLRR